MNIPITKLLAFVFWDIRRFFKFMYDDGLAEFKALAVIVCAEILGVFATASMISVFLGYKILPTSKPLFFLLAIGLSLGVTGMNYYLFSYRRSSAQFEAEFENYSVRARLIGNLAVLAVICAIFAATLIFTGLARHLPPNRSPISPSDFHG